jgi:FkbM family methyltransferase
MERHLECAMPIYGRPEFMMEQEMIFDQPHYMALNVARGEALRGFLASIVKEMQLNSAVDVGCGVGYFSSLLQSLHLDVLALDGRAENIEEAKVRVPGVEFRLADAEDGGIRSLGKFDLALCFGLLYHLENPFAAIRNLFALTQKIAVVEGMCIPGDEPLFGVRDEGPTEDQGLRYIALYPTESCLVKLLYRSGFPFVYRFRIAPAHRDFQTSRIRRQVRTILAASTVPLNTEMLVLAAEPTTNPDPWTINTTGRKVRRGLSRAKQFLKKPGREKARAVSFHWRRVFPRIPIPVRLPFGSWWLARNDFVGSAFFGAGFENIERSFVEVFLRPGMTVLDIGAHHGFYTLLASRKVGSRGRVIAVDASPRERKKLRLNLWINRCRNVTVESHALGEAVGTAELYLVCGTETGCNSLRAPDVAQPTERVQVSVEPLDRMLRRHKIDQVDFIKMDVEGAELSVLKGAHSLLSRPHRPVMLIEVYDIRTRPWGYSARDIIVYLTSLGFHWFCPVPNGALEELDCEQLEYSGNFVAVPSEDLGRVRALIASKTQESSRNHDTQAEHSCNGQ